MKFTILTIFPKVFNEYFNTSILKKAIDKKIIEIEVIDFRLFSNDKHKKVDDAPFGGVPGMVLKLQPIVDAIKYYKNDNSFVISLDPIGELLNNDLIKNLKSKKHIILLCGHYEGFDGRIKNYIDKSISIGDYILSGGELAAMIVVDSITRKLNNVINEKSLVSESFENNLLDHSVYTRPENFEGYKVPEILLSGNRAKIENYLYNERVEKTKKYRKDLYLKYKKEGGK